MLKHLKLWIVILAIFLAFFNYPLQKYPIFYRILQLIAIAMAITIFILK